MMIRRTFVLVLFMSIAFFAGLVLTGRMRTADETAASNTGQAAAPKAAPVTIAGGLPDLTGIAQRAVASVTNISSTQIVRTSNSPFANDPFYRFFFGDQDDAFGYRERRAQSLGSGVIVSSDGYVLTNNHVIDQGVEVTVTMPDKRELRAQIVGADEPTDIAVLKIAATNLPTMPWGDSSKLKVAEWVLAIGNPYQLNQSVTLGIVSALGRTLEGRTFQDFIQTDAAINPGNSGGALVNSRGELVGINTAIFSETGGYQGIGFAVPSNLARHIMDELIKNGQVQRGTIAGITLAPMTTRLAEELGAPSTRGMVVVSMQQRSDAYAAGLRPGDIVVSFNGTAIEDQGQFARMLSEAKIGSTVTLGILREGKQMTMKVPVVKSTSPMRRR
jgi:Do/DeqQ family serine protease